MRLLTLLLKIILYPLQQLAQLLFPVKDFDGLTPQVTAKAAEAFSFYLRSLIPTLHDVLWSTVGFAQLKQDALQSNQLVLVYLHAPLHRDADAVARNLLCHETVLPLLQQYRCFGISIHTAQGAQLAQILEAASFPLIAVLQVSRGSSTPLTLIMKLQGHTLACMPHQQLTAYLHNTLQRHEMTLAELEARNIQREQEVQLRRDQDDEYHATLLADQERHRNTLLERERVQRTMDEADDAARKMVENKEHQLRQARNILRPPPTEGGANLRFVLSSGKKIERRFDADDTVGTLRAFLTVHFVDNDLPAIASVGLSTSYPKTSFNEDADNAKTLQEVGLVPQAVLMVQDLDA
jgi:FAS-associated factor 2